MAYTWNGMRKLSWEEVKELGRKGEFPSNKYYFLYDNGTEVMMDTDTSWVDIIEHYEENGGNVGGQFGAERSIGYERLEEIADNLVDYMSDCLGFGADRTEKILERIGMSKEEIKELGWNSE